MASPFADRKCHVLSSRSRSPDEAGSGFSRHACRYPPAAGPYSLHLAGQPVLALLFGLPVAQWPATAGLALVHPQTVFLALIVALILVFSDLLGKTGQATRLMDSLTGYLTRPRLRLVFFPVLIGLLPMPGGAVFSAPMLGSVSEKLDVPPTDRALLNYWFRHVWETWWPLYPGIILAASICNISIGRIALYGLPGMAVMLALGWFFMLRPAVLPLAETVLPVAVAADEGGVSTPAAHARNWREVLRLGLPLLVAIAGAVLMEVGIALWAPQVPFELGVTGALLAAIGVAMVQNPGSAPLAWQSLVRGHLWEMLGVVFAIFIFKDVLAAAGVVEEISRLAGGATALMVAAVLLPFLVGMVSGITLAYVGATFPLLTGVLAQTGMQEHQMAYVMLAIFSGFTGIMCTPLHICFVLTCRYFHVDIVPVWRRLVVPCLLLLGCGVGYFFLLS